MKSTGIIMQDTARGFKGRLACPGRLLLAAHKHKENRLVNFHPICAGGHAKNKQILQDNKGKTGQISARIHLSRRVVYKENLVCASLWAVVW